MRRTAGWVTGAAIAHNRYVASSLSEIPVGKRKHMAAVLGLFAVLFVAVGAVAATGASSAALQVFVAVAIVAGLLLALMSWGIMRSVTLERSGADLDALITEAVERSGGSMCDCGHEHDPTELHVTDDPCEKDGHGHECTHTCETCVLQTLRRPSPGARRPSPTPR